MNFLAIACLNFFNLLGQDIEIVIRPHTDANREAGIKVS